MAQNKKNKESKKKERIYYTEAQYGYYKTYMEKTGKDRYDSYKFLLVKEKDGTLEEWKQIATKHGYKAFSAFVKDAMKFYRNHLENTKEE